MLAVYLNYPNPTISAHPGRSSAALKKQQKVDQRLIRIDAATLSAELLRFGNKTYKFAADAVSNDMWLEINFDDPAFEQAVLEHIQRLLGRHYAPFAGVQIQTHT